VSEMDHDVGTVQFYQHSISFVQVSHTASILKLTLLPRPSDTFFLTDDGRSQNFFFPQFFRQKKEQAKSPNPEKTIDLLCVRP